MHANPIISPSPTTWPNILPHLFSVEIFIGPMDPINIGKINFLLHIWALWRLHYKNSSNPWKILPLDLIFSPQPNKTISPPPNPRSTYTDVKEWVRLGLACHQFSAYKWNKSINFWWKLIVPRPTMFIISIYYRYCHGPSFLLANAHTVTSKNLQLDFLF